MTLHLVTLPISQRGLARWAGARGLGAGRVQDDGYLLHVLLSGLFGKGVLQPFRVFQPGTGDATLYGYSAQDAARLRETADLAAMPETLDVIALDRLRGKVMPVTRPGQRVGFDLRVRPTRRLTAGSRVRERDAYVAEAFRLHPDNPEGLTAEGRDREAVYIDWVAERIAGATIETARLAQFERTRVLRNGRPLEGPDATLHGTLVVTDPDVFSGALAQGIGRHRAWGYGMLLLRPPDAPVPMR